MNKFRKEFLWYVSAVSSEQSALNNQHLMLIHSNPIRGIRTNTKWKWFYFAINAPFSVSQTTELFRTSTNFQNINNLKTFYLVRWTLNVLVSKMNRNIFIPMWAIAHCPSPTREFFIRWKNYYDSQLFHIFKLTKRGNAQYATHTGKVSFKFRL